VENTKGKNEFIQYFLLVVFMFLLVHVVVYTKAIIDTPNAELVDTDPYMRLVRVEQLAETGDWYDSVIHRSNYPYGDELHWTRPLDVILVAGAYLLSPIQGFQKGILTWGIMIGPLVGIFCLLALFWATRKILNRNAQRLLWLLFIAQTLLFQIFTFGRPDHHSLLMLLFILLLGCLFRIIDQPHNNKYILISGFIAALSLWVSVETIFAIIMVFVTLAFFWLIRGAPYSRQLLLFSLSIFAFATAFLFIERPLSALFIVEYDKISIVYIFVLAVAVSATYLITLIRNSSLIFKLVQSILILIMSGLTIWFVFPAFLHGPMAGINKDIVPIWLSKVQEIQPLWALDPYHMIIIIGSIILFLLYFIYLTAKKRLASNLNLLLPIITGFAIFLPLGIYQVRMDYYLLIIIIMLLAVFLDDILASISNSELSNFSKPLVRVVVMLLFVLGLPGIGFWAAPQHSSQDTTTDPDLKSLSSFLNNYNQSDPSAKTILTYLDFGPELLYRTDFNLIATPYHRNDQGILYSYRVMAADSMEKAQDMLNERSIDLLIVCPESSEKGFYKRTVDHSTFYERLIAGEKPAFLEEVDLPPEVDNSLRVYRVVN